MISMSEKKKTILKLLFSLIIILIIVVIFYFIFRHFGLNNLSKEEMQKFIESTGAWAPIIFILITFLQVTFIPIPSTITILAGNYLFGPWLSYLYSVIGLFLGGLFAFFLGKKVGRPFVNWLVGDKEKIDKWLIKLRGREKVLLFFMLLMPYFPDDLLCAIAGLLPISYLSFIIMTIITRITSTGATLLFMSGEVIPFEGWGIPITILLILIGIIAFILSIKYADKIDLFFKNLSDRITSKIKKR